MDYIENSDPRRRSKENPHVTEENEINVEQTEKQVNDYKMSNQRNVINDTKMYSEITLPCGISASKSAASGHDDEHSNESSNYSKGDFLGQRRGRPFKKKTRPDINTIKRRITYWCINCSASFSSNYLLKRHTEQQKHFGQRIYHYECCNQLFAGQSEYINHLRSHNHVTENSSCRLTPFMDKNRVSQVCMCDLCNRKISSKSSSLNVHMRNHFQVFICDICSQVYSSRQALHRHMSIHTKGCFRCACGITFRNRTQLQKHKTKIHRSSTKLKERCLKRSPCPLCGKECTLDNMNTHIKTHSRNNSSICHFCGKQFPNLNLLRNHMAKIHLVDVCSVQCEICGKICRNKDSLRNHKRRVHGQRRYYCSQCLAKFKSSWDLKKHEITIHISERNYKCEYCSKFFKTIAQLKLHHVVHTKIKAYSCETCEKSFSQYSSLATHKKIHSQDKRYECNVCHRKFIQSYALKRRVLTHTGERPHKCDQCQADFRQVYMLTKHEQKHHQDKAKT